VSNDAPSSGGASASSGPDQVSQGIDRIRETAKWLTAAFGALGGALITSLQIKDLGGLSGHARTVALEGFAVAIAGVLIALVATAYVLTAARVSLQDVRRTKYLQKYIGSDHDLLLGYESLEDVIDVYKNSARDRVRAYTESIREYYDQPDGRPSALPEDAATELRNQREHDLAFARAQLEFVNPVVHFVLGVAAFECIRRRWRRVAVPGIVVGVALAALGTGLFAIQVGAASKSTTESSAASEALISITAAGEHAIGPRLGPNCDLDQLAVVVLDRYPTGWDLHVVDPRCQPATFQATNDEISVIATVQACPVPSAAASARTQSLSRYSVLSTRAGIASVKYHDAIGDHFAVPAAATPSPTTSRGPPPSPGSPPTPPVVIC
jgi:hypothetical protein